MKPTIYKFKEFFSESLYTAELFIFKSSSKVDAFPLYIILYIIHIGYRSYNLKLEYGTPT